VVAAGGVAAAGAAAAAAGGAAAVAGGVAAPAAAAGEAAAAVAGTVAAACRPAPRTPSRPGAAASRPGRAIRAAVTTQAAAPAIRVAAATPTPAWSSAEHAAYRGKMPRDAANGPTLASHVVEAVIHGIDLTQAVSRAYLLALPLIGWRRVRRGMLTGGCESGGQAAGTDPARGQAKVDGFWRFGCPRHANQLFWHVFGLPAG
jgi:hypothetical protein